MNGHMLSANDELVFFFFRGKILMVIAKAVSISYLVITYSKILSSTHDLPRGLEAKLDFIYLD